MRQHRQLDTLELMCLEKPNLNTPHNALQICSQKNCFYKFVRDVVRAGHGKEGRVLAGRGQDSALSR